MLAIVFLLSLLLGSAVVLLASRRPYTSTWPPSRRKRELAEHDRLIALRRGGHTDLT